MKFFDNVIRSIRVMINKNGVHTCYRCNKLIWPNQVRIKEGNVFEGIFPTMSRHAKPCDLSTDSNEYKVLFIAWHILTTFYKPGYFAKSSLDRSWKKYVDFIENRGGSWGKDSVEFMRENPIHQLVAEKMISQNKYFTWKKEYEK